MVDTRYRRLELDNMNQDSFRIPKARDNAAKQADDMAILEKNKASLLISIERHTSRERFMPSYGIPVFLA